MGILDSIFGTQSSVQSMRQDTLTPEQSSALSALMARLGGGGGDGVTPYGGELTTQTSKLQNLSLAAMEQQAMNLVNPASESNQAAKAYQDVIGASPQDIQDYFQKSVETPLLRDFQTKVLPSITARFRGTAGFGSDRMMQERLATNDLTTNLAGALSSASLQALRDQQANKLSAASGLAGIPGQRANVASTLLTGGAVPQATEAANKAALYNEFVRQQGSKQTNIQNILAALGIRSFENVNVVKPGQPGLIQGLAGGVGQGLGMYAAKAMMAP